MYIVHIFYDRKFKWVKKCNRNLNRSFGRNNSLRLVKPFRKIIAGR